MIARDLATLLLCTAPLAAQQTQPQPSQPSQPSQQADFRWEKALAAGGMVTLHNLNGDVTVTPSTSGKVEVVGVKRGNRRDFDDVTIEVVETSRGITVCSMFRGRDMTCDESGFRMRDDRRGRGRYDDWDDVTINIEVRLPNDLTLDARSVSGDVTVSVESLTGDGDLTFTSVSGDVTAELPKGIDADVTMRSVSGSLDSEFPLTLNGRMTRRSLEARIGKGGRTLEVRTVSGDVRLRAAK